LFRGITSFAIDSFAEKKYRKNKKKNFSIGVIEAYSTQWVLSVSCGCG